MDKRWLLVCALVVGVVLFVIFLVPFFVNADAFRPALESQLSEALGREVSMGKLTFSLVQRSLVAEDIIIADDPAFSSVPFVQAKSLAVGIKLMPLLYHQQVRITKVAIDTPSMQLIKHSSGKWNYSSLGPKSSAGTTAQHSSASDLGIGELRIVNGSALVSSVPATAKPFGYSEVSMQATQISLVEPFPFELSAKLPGGGTLKLTGHAGPVTRDDMSRTPFQASLELREFNPAASGLIEPNKGITMDNDVDAEIRSDGTHLTGSGKIKASRLQLVPRGSPAQEPVDIDFSIGENLDTHEGTISDVVVHAGTGTVHVKGSFKPAAGVTTVRLHLSAPGLPLEQLERLLPVVGIQLPTGSSLQGGTLTSELDITGPATGTTIAGAMEIENTRLTRFDLGSKIPGLKPLGGNGTEIRVLKANVNSTPESTRLASIYGDLPQLGTATGDGTVAPSGELDFHLIAKLNGASEAGSKTEQPARGASVAGRSMPLTITGTAASPLIQANAGAIAR